MVVWNCRSAALLISLLSVGTARKTGNTVSTLWLCRQGCQGILSLFIKM